MNRPDFTPDEIAFISKCLIAVAKSYEENDEDFVDTFIITRCYALASKIDGQLNGERE